MCTFVLVSEMIVVHESYSEKINGVEKETPENDCISMNKILTKFKKPIATDSLPLVEAAKMV